jgi:hypothetical protein
MTVSLNDADGRPVSAFGSNSQWSQGAVTNQAEFGNSAPFGRNLNVASATTPSPISATTAGSTSKLGYTNPLKSAPRAGGGMMTPSAPGGGLRQLNAPDNMKPDATPVGMAVKAGTKKWGPQPAPGEKDDQEPTQNPGAVLAGGAVRGIGNAVSRIGSMRQGATEGRGSTPSGLFGDAEEAV